MCVCTEISSDDRTKAFDTRYRTVRSFTLPLKPIVVLRIIPDDGFSGRYTWEDDGAIESIRPNGKRASHYLTVKKARRNSQNANLPNPPGGCICASRFQGIDRVRIRIARISKLTHARITAYVRILSRTVLENIHVVSQMHESREL